MHQSLEQLALLEVRKQFPLLRRKGFAAAVRAAVSADWGEDFFIWSINSKHIPIIPDGWFEEPTGAFTCIEIEDRNPLSYKKLEYYGLLWDVLDYCNSDDYGLRLFVFDRYGLNRRELDLCEVYLSGLRRPNPNGGTTK